MQNNTTKPAIVSTFNPTCPSFLQTQARILDPPCKRRVKLKRTLRKSRQLCGFHAVKIYDKLNTPHVHFQVNYPSSYFSRSFSNDGFDTIATSSMMQTAISSTRQYTLNINSSCTPNWAYERVKLPAAPANDGLGITKVLREYMMNDQHILSSLENMC